MEMASRMCLNNVAIAPGTWQTSHVLCNIKERVALMESLCFANSFRYSGIIHSNKSDLGTFPISAGESVTFLGNEQEAAIASGRVRCIIGDRVSLN